MTTPLPPQDSTLSEQLAREGLKPTRWSNGPDAVYGVHDHPYGKVLVVEQGSITFTIDGGRKILTMIPPPDSQPTAGQWALGARYRIEPTGRSASGGPSQVVGMKRGDRLDLPPRTPHSAVVGPEGVVCLEAHIRPKRSR